MQSDSILICGQHEQELVMHSMRVAEREDVHEIHQRACEASEDCERIGTRRVRFMQAQEPEEHVAADSTPGLDVAAVLQESEWEAGPEAAEDEWSTTAGGAGDEPEAAPELADDDDG